MTKQPDLTEAGIHGYKLILQAAKAGKLGVMACIEKGTGKAISVLVAKEPSGDGTNHHLHPLAMVYEEDPTAFLQTPEGYSLDCKGDSDNDIQQHSE